MPCRMLCLSLVPSKRHPQTLSPTLGLLPRGLDTACLGNQGVEPNFGNSLSISPDAGGRSSGKKSQAHRCQKRGLGAHFFLSQGRGGDEGMSITYPLCFGTWQGTRPSPWPRGQLPHKSSRDSLAPAQAALPLPQPSMETATRVLCALLILSTLCWHSLAQSEHCPDLRGCGTGTEIRAGGQG